MYPALGVTNGLITIEDLPDTVIYRGLISGDKTFTKLDPPEEYGTYTAYYITGSFPVGADGDFIGIDSAGALDQWTNYVGGGINGIGYCLIESFNNITGVNDTFEDTYTISITVNDIISSIVVTRDSLCVWRGEEFTDGGGSNRLLALVWVDNPTIIGGGVTIQQTWAVEDVGRGLYPKDGFLNNPIGTYGINVSVS